VILFIVFAVSVEGYGQSIDFGPRTGVFLKNTDFFAGAQVDVKPVKLIGLHVVPYFDYIFAENIDSQWLFGANVLYEMIPLGIASLYAGGGIGYLRTTFDTKGLLTNDKDSDTVYNIVGGARFNLVGVLKPYANVRYIISDSMENTLIIEGGLHFTIF